jgi:hypothetical protein
LELGANVKKAWDHPEASIVLKKRILRTVIHEIVADVDEANQQVVFCVHWDGGVHSTLRVQKNRTGCHHRVTERAVVDLVRDLAQVCADPAITLILNRLEYRTGTGKSWTESRVHSMRQTYHIAAFDSAAPRWWINLEEAATELDTHPNGVRKLIERKILPAKQVVKYAPW